MESVHHGFYTSSSTCLWICAEKYCKYCFTIWFEDKVQIKSHMTMILISVFVTQCHPRHGITELWAGKWGLLVKACGERALLMFFMTLSLLTHTQTVGRVCVLTSISRIGACWRPYVECRHGLFEVAGGGCRGKGAFSLLRSILILGNKKGTNLNKKKKHNTSWCVPFQIYFF